MNIEQTEVTTAYTAQSDSEDGGVVSRQFWLTEDQAVAHCPEVELDGETVSTTTWQIIIPSSLLRELSEDGLHFNRIYQYCDPKLIKD